jgi:hypothetical protein
MDIHLKGQLPFPVTDLANVLECRLMGCIVDKYIRAASLRIEGKLIGVE